MALAQAQAERFTQTGRLAAAFFFSRSDASRDKLDQFIVTVGQPLVTSSTLRPLLATLIDRAIRSTPGIWEKNWENQFKVIIQEPCAQVNLKRWGHLPRLVIIDGLDECIDVASQKRLLDTIKASTTLSLNFSIFSRPEPHITRIFRQDSFVPAPRVISVGDFPV